MLQEKLRADMVAAQKAGDAARLGTLRFLQAQVQNRAIEKRGTALTDEDVLQVLQKEAKKRREAADAYRAGGRAELAAKEEAELTIVASYLPAQLSRDEVAAVVRRAIKKGPADFAAVMKEAMAELRGKADGKLVSEVVREELG